MLKMREDGIGPTELARRFGVDHSTIIYHVKKSGIASDVRRTEQEKRLNTRTLMAKKQTMEIPRIGDDGYRINLGKNYADYLKDMEKKKWDRLLKGANVKIEYEIKHSGGEIEPEGIDGDDVEDDDPELE